MREDDLDPTVNALPEEPGYPPAKELLAVYGEFAREPGKRGRWSEDDHKAKKAFYEPHETYEAMRRELAETTEQLRIARQVAADQDQAATERARAVELAHVAEVAALNADNEALRREVAELIVDKQVAAERGELLATVMTQLQHMMPGDEFEPVVASELPAHASVLRKNSRVTVELHYGNRRTFTNTRLRVASHDPSRRPLPPIYVDIDGIKPNDVVLLAGYLHLPNGPELTARARETYKLKTPRDEPSTDTKDGEVDLPQGGSTGSFLQNLMAAFETLPRGRSLVITASKLPEGYDLDAEDPVDPLGFQAEDKAAANRQPGATSGDASNN